MISKKKKLAAGVISALVPGAGQFLVRRTTAGIVWAAAFLVFLLVSSLARFWSNYYGLVVSAWGVMIFASVAAFNASFRPKGEVGPSRFWVILFIAVAFVPTQLMQVAWWLGGYRVFIVPSTSMQPTIWIGDRIIADSHYFRTRHIKQGEIIVFKKDDLSLVKRVEAVPGDVIEGMSGTIYLNGRELDEGFEKPNAYPAAEFLATFGPEKVPAAEYFVLGDNRSVSRDSRAPGYGNIPSSDIVGRVLYVFNPLDPSHNRNLGRFPEP